MRTKSDDIDIEALKKQLAQSERQLRNAESKIKQLEDQQRSILNNLVDEVHVWKLIEDKNGRIKAWKLIDLNQVAIKSLGKEKEEVVGKTMEEIFGSEITDTFRPIVNQIFKSSKPHRWLEYFDSKKQYLSMTCIPLGDRFISTGKDTTEETLLHNQLQEKASLLVKAEEMSKQGSWKFNIQTKQWNFSNNWMKIFGFSKIPNTEELTEALDTKDLPWIRKAFENAIRGIEDYNVEHRIKLPSGQFRWVKDSAKLQYSEDGEPVALIGITLDITDERNQQKELSESKSILTRTGEIAKVGGWIMEGDFKRPAWTKGTYDIHDLPYDHIPTTEEGINFYHPEDRELVKNSVNKAISEGKDFQFEARIKSAKGINKWVLAKGKPEIIDGKCVKILGVFQDITERKKAEIKLAQSEEKFKSIFKYSSVAKILADNNGKCIDVNEKSCELLGYTFEELTSLSIQEIVYKKGKYKNDIFEKLSTNGEDSSVVMLKRKDGKIKIVEYYAKKVGKNRYLSTLIDITTRKKLEKEKYKTDQRLQKIADSVPGTIFQFVFHKDGTGSMPYLNIRAEDLLGFEIEKMRNPEFLISRIHPDDFKNTMYSIVEANHDNAKWLKEFRLFNKNNEIVWVRGQSAATADAKGNISHYGVLFDITEQKESEKALEESRRQYKNIADNLPGIVLKYKLNPDGSDQLIYASEGLKDIVEVSPKDAVLDNSLVWNRTHREDIDDFRQSLKDSAKNLSQWKFETRIKLPGDRTKWIDFRGTPIKQTDGSIIWDAIGLDITKRKQAESELEQINVNLERLVDERAEKALKLSKELELYWLAAEHAKTGVFRYNNINGELDWDKTMYELYGIDKEKSKQRYDVWESSLHPEDYEQTIAALKQTIENQVDFDIIFRIIQKNTGEIRHIRAKAKAEVDNEGRTVSIYGTNYDVTKEMELANQNEIALKELKDAQATLVQSEKMASLGVLTAGIAHELNNPLNYIVGGISAIRSHLDDDEVIKREEIKEYLSWINTGAERATDIVRSLNLFSRKSDNKKEICDLHLIINDCLLMLKNRFKENIDVVKEFSDTSAEVLANYGKLHQVILNVLSNSIDAIKNEGQIHITTKSKKDKFIVEIIDNGFGIPKDEIDKVIDPFFTTKPPGVGTGLGLSIASSIIQDYDGKFKISSEINKGTSVLISLPKKS
jgi:PAS domain S-box-containing protein